MLGNGRCECFCFDGVTRLGHIRGKMRKKVWITAGDIVLVGKRDFQDEKVDIVHKYSADEARNLKQYGELPETARINETAVDMAMSGNNDDDDIGIDFDGEEDVSKGCDLYVLCGSLSHPTFISCRSFFLCQTFKDIRMIWFTTDSLLDVAPRFCEHHLRIIVHRLRSLVSFFEPIGLPGRSVHCASKEGMN
jgi:translation initiation factor 1A